MLVEVLISFGLFFVSALSICNLLHNASQGFAQAVETGSALNLAEDGLELVRSGAIEAKVGKKSLPPITLQQGSCPQTYQPALEISPWKEGLWVRSSVTWRVRGQTHRVEVKCFVADP